MLAIAYYNMLAIAHICGDGSPAGRTPGSPGHTLVSRLINGIELAIVHDHVRAHRQMSESINAPSHQAVTHVIGSSGSRPHAPPTQARRCAIIYRSLTASASSGSSVMNASASICSVRR